MEAAIFLLCGAFFLTRAWRMLSREDWTTTNDREAYEDNPTWLRAANYRLSEALTRVVVPIALTALGVVSVAQGIAALI